MTPKSQNHLLSDKMYAILNALAILVLPAAGTLYFALAQIWGLPAGEQVVGSIVAVDTFLGVVVKAGEMSYDNSAARFAGAIVVTDSPDKTLFSLELNHDPDELKHKDKVTFLIKTNEPPAQPAVVVPIPNNPVAPSQ